ncbi:related to Peroxisomal membrane protein PEX28 [Nakaseomyces glabratus]|nr:related to Peroxisomal membrane protein PEX28 [Nakaseomyces glabratus]
MAEEAIAARSNRDELTQRELVQQVMGVLVSTSLERLKPEHVSAAAEEKELDELNEYRRSLSQDRLSKEDTYFLDMFLDKLIARLIPDNLPEREHFSLADDGDEALHGPPFSASVLASNMKKLSGKMDSIFEFQDNMIRVLTWKTPTVTLTALTIFTLICFDLMNVILFPMAYIVLVQMTQGRSLIHDLFHGGKKTNNVLLPSNENDCNGEQENEADLGTSDDCNGTSDENVVISPAAAKIDKNISTYNLNHGTKVVLTLRDMQNMTTGTVHLMDAIDKFKYGTAAFVDEYKSTSVFFTLLGSVILLVLLSRFITWSLTISLSAWIGLLSIHPKVHPYVKSAKNIMKKPKMKPENSPQDVAVVMEDNISGEDYNRNIILDEPPDVKYVEVYEIYKRGLLPTDWEFFKFSSTIFDPTDTYRKALQLPPGVDKIEEIKPPAGWAFDENSSWIIDKNPEIWAIERGLQLPVEEGFLVDPMFKRRRLVRKVIRYKKPMKIKMH